MERNRTWSRMRSRVESLAALLALLVAAALPTGARAQEGGPAVLADSAAVLKALGEPSGNGTKIKNLASDVYFAVINPPSRVDASWSGQPVDIQHLILGYTRGVNRFLRDAGGALPEACRGQPWVREITHGDVVRLMRRFAVEGSGERMIEAIFAAQPPVVPPGVPNPIPIPFPRS